MNTPRSAARRVGLILACLALGLTACRSGSSLNASSGSTPDGTAPGVDCPVEALATAETPIRITVWHALNAVPKVTFEALVAEYNAGQDRVFVQAESQGSAFSEIWNKYQSAAAGGDLPDIVQQEDIHLQAMADSGTVLPAQACIDADRYDLATFNPSAVAAYRIGGVLVPASVNLSTPLLYFNEDHFAAAGLAPDRTPGTLAEVRELAQQLKDAGISSTPLALCLHPWFIDNWLTGVDVAVVNNDNGRGAGTTGESTFDNATTVELFTWIKAMVDDGLALAVPYDGKTIDHYLAVVTGVSSMMFETSNASGSIASFLEGETVNTGDRTTQADPSPGIRIGAGPFPGLSEPGQVKVSGSAWFMTMSGDAARRAASWEFMKWWNSPAIQARWQTEGSYLPFNEAAIEDPALQAAWRDTPSGRWQAMAHAQMTTGIDPALPGPAMGPYEVYQQAKTNQLAAVALKGKTPADAVTSVAATTTNALQTYLNQGF